jgi:uncharacterized protein (UPF0332 family)
MDLSKTEREYARFKLAQANEALEDARGLLVDNAELNYVVNSLYYAMYYPALALLHARGSPAAMQSVSVALFAREFVPTGDRSTYSSMPAGYSSLSQMLGPQFKMISRLEVEALLPMHPVH